MPTEKRRFFGLQILRGLAAVLVLFHHQLLVGQDHIPGMPMPSFLDDGAFGVDIFFPISGFVMYLTATSLSRRTLSGIALSGEFLWRRIVRIVPVYWMLTTLKLLLFVAAPALMMHFTLRPWNVVASYFFIPSFDHNSQAEPVIPVGWTLNAEMMFYAILAAALTLRVSLMRFVATVVVLLSIVGLFHNYPSDHAWQALLYWTNPVALEFVGGMAIAATLDRFRSTPVWLTSSVLVASLAFALSRDVGPVFTFSKMRPVIWGIPGLLVVWAVLCLEPHLRLHKQRFFLLLGDASYSLYLLQTFMIPAFGFLAARAHLTGVRGLLLLFLVSTPIVLGLSILFHLYVELPILRSLSQRPPPWSTRSAEAA